MADLAFCLADLRKRKGWSQAEQARAMGVGQSRVSKVEHADDLNITTLDNYVSALGGHLLLHARFDDEILPLYVPASGEPEPDLRQTNAETAPEAVVRTGVPDIVVRTIRELEDRYGAENILNAMHESHKVIEPATAGPRAGHLETRKETPR